MAISVFLSTVSGEVRLGLPFVCKFDLGEAAKR